MTPEEEKEQLVKRRKVIFSSFLLFSNHFNRLRLKKRVNQSAAKLVNPLLNQRYRRAKAQLQVLEFQVHPRYYEYVLREITIPFSLSQVSTVPSLNVLFTNIIILINLFAFNKCRRAV
jgi:hypothetical protein